MYLGMRYVLCLTMDPHIIFRHGPKRVYLQSSLSALSPDYLPCGYIP